MGTARWIMKVAFVCSMTLALSASAQNTFPANGNVGVGTTNPQDALDIEGGGYLRVGSFFHVGSEGAGSILFNPSGNYMRFLVGSSQVLWLASSGNVGIGTMSPRAMLDVNGSVDLGLDNNSNIVSFSKYNDSFPYASLYAGQSSSAGATGWLFQYRDNNGNGQPGLYIAGGNGNIGLGTTSPNAKLEVAGSIKLTNGSGASGASMTFADGTMQTTAWTGTVCGGDYAESVDVAGERKNLEPGDVLVLDPENPGKARKSSEAYSPLVSGVYSTKPGTVGRRQATPKSEAEVPMAMVGVVPTKVSTENGAIRVGDLLVTSSKPGYAMRGTDRGRILGAVIGKAMGTLSAGTGVIEVLITLQ